MLQLPSGKNYIGVTLKSFEIRFRNHKGSSGSKNAVIQKAINKYGRNNITIKPLVISDDEEYLYQLEKDAIRQYNTLTPNGYNRSEGGGKVRTYIKSCKECGTNFEARLDAKFCGRSCYDKYRWKNGRDTAVICEHCETSFMRHKKEMNIRFCSIQCAQKYRTNNQWRRGF